MNGTGINEIDPSQFLSNVASEMTLVSLFLTLFLALMGWYFYWKQAKEKKNEMMFNWVHNKLSTKIYIPLNGWVKTLSEVLSWDDYEINYKSNYLLYATTKFLKFRYMNKHTVGDDVFFTTSILSNRYLSELINLILIELNSVLVKNLSEKEKVENRFILTQFLSKLGNCTNYTEFNLLIRGRNLYNNQLSNEIKILINNLYEEGFLSKLPNQMESYLIAIKSLFGREIEDNYRREKIKICCDLFYCIMELELHYMYRTWYRKEKIPDIKKIYASIEYIKYLFEKTDIELDTYKELISDNKFEQIKENVLDIEILEEIIHNTNIIINKSEDTAEIESLCAKRNGIMIELSRRKIIENMEEIGNVIDRCIAQIPNLANESPETNAIINGCYH